MSSKPQPAEAPKPRPKHQLQPRPKLPKLPKNVTITKRPLLHAPPASKFAGPTSQKVLYLSMRTPFMSATKRIEKFLAQVEKRETQSAAQVVKNESRKKRKYNNGDDGADGEAILGVAKKLAEKKEADEGEGLGNDEVVVRATGRAVQKALAVGVWFLKKEGYGVRIKTGSVGAIDDIDVAEDGDVAAGAAKDGDDAGKVDGDEGEEKVQQDIPESRIRYASTVEIAVFKT